MKVATENYAPKENRSVLTYHLSYNRILKFDMRSSSPFQMIDNLVKYVYVAIHRQGFFRPLTKISDNRHFVMTSGGQESVCTTLCFDLAVL